MSRIVKTLVLATTCWLGVSSVSIAAQPDAVVYIAKDIVTMDSNMPHAQAVAVAGGRILATGSQKDMLKLVGGNPLSVDRRFADKVILPGLIEQHIHPVLSALTLTTQVISIEDWVLPDTTVTAVHSPKDYLKRLREAEARLSDPNESLLSWGYHEDFHGKLTRVELDAISDTRPIMIWHRSAHEFLLNTPALRLVAVDANLVAAQSPIIKKQVNLAEGHFWEQGFFDFLLPRLMPIVASPERLKSGLQFTARYLHAAGVTTSAEPGGTPAVFYPIENAVLGNEATPFRFYFIPDGRALAANHQGKALITATEDLLQGMSGHTAFLHNQVKLFADGAIFSQRMQMQEGYTDGHEGEWLMEPDNFASAFRTYWDAGYQIHVHQNGDAALEMVLDTLERNMKRNPRKDHRTTIVHFGFATPKQVQRIVALNAIVSANPYYPVALADRYSKVGIGPERTEQMVRLGDVVKAGIPFSLHSDMPMAPARPLFLMGAAVNRTTFSGRVVGPKQRITAEQALKAVTLDAAYSLRLEHEIGSITPGKLANFTVVEQSPLQVKPAAIKDIGIWGTVLEGRLQPILPTAIE